MTEKIAGLFATLVYTALASGPSINPMLLSARDAQDRTALDKAVSFAKAAAEKAPSDANAQYQFALASSLLGEVALEQKDKPAAEKAAIAGVKAAEAAIAMNGKNAEYYRVTATLCGQIIPANIFSALSYGKRAKDAIEKAKQLDPRSPLVWIADGVGNYYLPSNFGGGPDPAIRSFRRAIELDAKNADAWLWLGLAQRKKQMNADARASFAKSLAFNPNRMWAKQQLDKTPAK